MCEASCRPARRSSAPRSSRGSPRACRAPPSAAPRVRGEPPPPSQGQFRPASCAASAVLSGGRRRSPSTVRGGGPRPRRRHASDRPSGRRRADPIARFARTLGSSIARSPSLLRWGPTPCPSPSRSCGIQSPPSTSPRRRRFDASSSPAGVATARPLRTICTGSPASAAAASKRCLSSVMDGRMAACTGSPYPGVEAGRKGGPRCPTTTSPFPTCRRRGWAGPSRGTGW